MWISAWWPLPWVKQWILRSNNEGFPPSILRPVSPSSRELFQPNFSLWTWFLCVDNSDSKELFWPNYTFWTGIWLFPIPVCTVGWTSNCWVHSRDVLLVTLGLGSKCKSTDWNTATAEIPQMDVSNFYFICSIVLIKFAILSRVQNYANHRNKTTRERNCKFWR